MTDTDTDAERERGEERRQVTRRALLEFTP
jgi:hypothetical protein